MQIKDYYTSAVSAGIITMLERPEIVNRLLTIFITNFKEFEIDKLTLETHHLKEELEEYREIDRTYLNHIKRLTVFYDGNQLMLAKLLKDINYNPKINTKVYSPVIGCPIGCRYCFTKNVVNHFGLTKCWEKPVFRGFYKITKDDEGNDVPELFNVKSEKRIDWFLTYMSDFGCWKPEWQQNIFEQIIAANDLKRRNGKPLDSFQLITKNPNGISLETIPKDTDLSNVVISCTVDTNKSTKRIADLIKRTGELNITTCITYQPVLEYIEPKYIDEFVETFGKERTWVIIGSELGNSEDKVELQFSFIKDIIDKCRQLEIPIKMEFDIRSLVLKNGYEFTDELPYCMR